MKTLNISFENANYERVVKIKDKSGLNWHDFIIKAAEAWEREKKK